MLLRRTFPTIPDGEMFDLLREERSFLRVLAFQNNLAFRPYLCTLIFASTACILAPV